MENVIFYWLLSVSDYRIRQMVTLALTAKVLFKVTSVSCKQEKLHLTYCVSANVLSA